MNYYRVTEKKPEHGGGWAFMQHNRRSGSAIVCACGAGGWTDRGHDTAEDAERCFHRAQTDRGVRWAKTTQASKCASCESWTPDVLEATSQLLFTTEYVCREHFDDDDAAAAWLWARHPFKPGIQITASW